MRHTLLCLLSVIAITGCQRNDKVTRNTDSNATTGGTYRFYSKPVNDTFSIFVKLPPAYDVKQKYPVVYVLDANFYYDMVAAMAYKYEDLGIINPAIIVGIGYKDFHTMDSLRDRDYSYPAALPNDSFIVSGGGAKFLHFISTELIPYVDKQYSTDTHNRILAGHSLGGLFTLYALSEYLAGRNNDFCSYIAASPHMRFANYYLLHQLDSLPAKNATTKAKVYVTYGGLEDKEEADEPVHKSTNEVLSLLSASIGKKQASAVSYQYDTYSAFGHMDMGVPTFTKGLLWALGE